MSPEPHTVREVMAHIIDAADATPIDERAPQIMALRVLLGRWLMSDPESLLISRRLMQLVLAMHGIVKTMEPDVGSLENYRSTVLKAFVTGCLVGAAALPHNEAPK